MMTGCGRQATIADLENASHILVIGMEILPAKAAPGIAIGMGTPLSQVRADPHARVQVPGMHNDCA
jgi:hypothetical protein